MGRDLTNTEQRNWKSIWKFNLKAIKENKIAEFNFKFLHDLIPHRYNRYKWKLSNNPQCVFDNDLHDSVHLFLNCEQSSLFWKRFQDLVKKLYNIDFTCNVYTLISGYNLENKHFASLNMLIMYAKYAVYVIIFTQKTTKLCYMSFQYLAYLKDQLEIV